ncbi:MAG: hypothetical protein IJM51_01655 [Clostridia bacterium]|nr:hypothetical protein [Clostridia bacterium]
MENQIREPDFAAAHGRVRSKKFRMCMKKLLSLPVKDQQAREELLSFGLDGRDADNYMLVTLAVFKKAVGGDIKFIQELRQIVSDNETEIDRKTGIAQLDKIRAQTEEIRRKFSPADDGGSQYMAEFFDALRSSAGGDGNTSQGGEHN